MAASEKTEKKRTAAKASSPAKKSAGGVKKPTSKAKTAATAKKSAAVAKKPAAASKKSAPAEKKGAARKTAPAARASVPKKSGDELYGESNALPFQIDDLKDAEKRKKIILIAAAALLLLLLLFFGIRGIARAASSSGAKGGSARQNTLALVQKYLDKGQYDKAMDLLNSLLISNPDDAEADKLLDEAIRQKKASDDAAAQNIVVQPGDSSYNINIDTDELTAALREQNEKSQQMINDLLEQQRQSQDAQRAEAAAEKKAAEELKKKEEAERKAKEAELAQKSAALKSKITGINEKIMAGKADLNTGNVDSALSNFKSAVSQLPLSEGEPAFSASKYSEVASSLFEAS
ncbi:MAG: hypothetical protein IJL24_03105, partial [Treponema sp.]|nr:hypothetical protein [Treponema sp.]